MIISENTLSAETEQAPTPVDSAGTKTLDLSNPETLRVAKMELTNWNVPFFNLMWSNITALKYPELRATALQMLSIPSAVLITSGYFLFKYLKNKKR